MFNLERWEEIFEGFSKNKLRTFLTGISVASGIFILVILLGAGRGIQNGIAKQFERDATNEISIWPGITQKEFKGLNIGRSIQFKNEDFLIISQLLAPYIDKKSATYSIWNGTVLYGKETGTYSVEGVYPDMQFIENSTIIKGRFVNHSDLKNIEKTAVIGNKVAQDLFKNETDPLGKNINISGSIYKVVGVYTDPGGERQESKVYLPITTAQKAFSGGNNIRSMNFTLKPVKDFDEAVLLDQKFMKEVEQILKGRHTVAPDDLSAINIYSNLSEAKKVYQITGGIQAFFWFVGICTIIAGVVGIGNIMLIVVKERTKEIGIRKALGATPFSIISMILHEAIFITLVSGFSGLIMGLLLWAAIGPSVESDFFTHPEVDFKIAVSTIFILVVAGCLAGFVPAYRAAKIKPIVALRDE